jgi:hypothetical protein
MATNKIYRRKPISSFAIGDTLRIIQSNDEIYYGNADSNDFNNSHVSGELFEFDNEKVKFKYLMNDTPRKHVAKLVNNLFSDDFRDWAENKSIDDASKVYYETDDIKLDKNKHKIFQINKKCYFLNTNQYFNQKEEEKFESDWKAYSIYQKYNNEVNDETNDKSYEVISSQMQSLIKSYDERYVNEITNVENKSIPIYNLDKNALKDLYIIRLTDQDEIIETLEENDLMSISGKCLFNSSTYSVDLINYDSLLIEPIYSYIMNTYSELNFYNVEEAFTKLFNSIFKRIPKESLYRILTPVGLIDVSSDYTKLNEKTQYLYSIDLRSDEESEFIKTNYFSLRNFSNPEMDYNYNIPNIDKYLSVLSGVEISSNISGYTEVSPSYYTIDNKLKFKILEDYQSVVLDNVTNYLKYNNMLETSGIFIENNGIIDDIVDEFKKIYSRTDENTIKKIFYSDENLNKEEIDMYVMGFKIYMYNKFNINIDKNPYIITCKEFKDKLNAIYKEFIPYLKDSLNKMQSEDEKELLSSVFDGFMNGSDIFKSANIYLMDFDQDLLTKDNVSIINDKLSISNLLNRRLDHRLTFKQNADYSNLMLSLSKLSGNGELAYKIDDYNSQLRDLYKHNNSFKLSGYLYGLREYQNVGLNSDNDIWLSYNYNSKFDKNFLGNGYISANYDTLTESEFLSEISGHCSILSGVMDVSDVSGIIEYDELSANLNDLNDFTFFSLNDLLLPENILMLPRYENLYQKDRFVFKDRDGTYLISKKPDANDTQNEDMVKMKNFYELTLAMQRIEFGEIIEGQHYYKEDYHSRSNIFSINIKNSGLTFKLYNYDELLNELQKNGLLSKFKLIKDFKDYEIRDAIKFSNFYAIFNKNNYYEDIETMDYLTSGFNRFEYRYKFDGKSENEKNGFEKWQRSFKLFEFYDHTNPHYQNLNLLKNMMFFKYVEEQKEYASLYDKIVDKIEIIENVELSSLKKLIFDYTSFTRDESQFTKLFKENRVKVSYELGLNEDKMPRIEDFSKYIIILLNKIHYLKKMNELNKLKEYEISFLENVYGMENVINEILKSEEAIKDKVEFAGKTIRAKYKMQKYFERSIRKSIHRYIPANTTLWKVQFSGK